MNTSFMRLLAERLEHLFWIEVIPEDCLFLEFFDSMDGFFISSDLKFWNRPPGFIFGDEDYFIGSIEDWAVELVQEQRGYYDDYEHEEDRYVNWHDAAIDDEFSERDVWLLASRSMGLGEKAEGCEFVVNEELELPRCRIRVAPWRVEMKSSIARSSLSAVMTANEGPTIPRVLRQIFQLLRCRRGLKSREFIHWLAFS